MDVFIHYPEWLYLILYSLPTCLWLVAALAIQIFTSKCFFVAWNLTHAKTVDPLKEKLQGKRIEHGTYIFAVIVGLSYLVAFCVSIAICNIGSVNRGVITASYSIVMCVTVISSTFFLCKLKSTYGSVFAK